MKKHFEVGCRLQCTSSYRPLGSIIALMAIPILRFINDTDNPLSGNPLDIGVRILFNMVDGLVKVKEIIDADGNETFIGVMSAA